MFSNLVCVSLSCVVVAGMVVSSLPASSAAKAGEPLELLDLTMQDGESLMGYVAVESLTIPSGATVYVEATTQVVARRTILIAGELRVRDRNLHEESATGIRLELYAEEEIDIRGHVVGGRGASFESVLPEDCVNLAAGNGSDLLFAAPLVWVQGTVVAGQGGVSGPGAPGGAGGSVTVYGRALIRPDTDVDGLGEFGLFGGGGGTSLQALVPEHAGRGGDGGQANVFRYERLDEHFSRPAPYLAEEQLPPRPFGVGLKSVPLLRQPVVCEAGQDGATATACTGGQGAQGATGANGTQASHDDGPGGTGGTGNSCTADNGTAGEDGDTCCEEVKGGNGGKGGDGGKATGGKGGKGGKGGTAYHDGMMFQGKGGLGGTGGPGSPEANPGDGADGADGGDGDEVGGDAGGKGKVGMVVAGAGGDSGDGGAGDPRGCPGGTGPPGGTGSGIDGHDGEAGGVCP